jgi:hypothetical protein
MVTDGDEVRAEPTSARRGQSLLFNILRNIRVYTSHFAVLGEEVVQLHFTLLSKEGRAGVVKTDYTAGKSVSLGFARA